MKSKVVSSYSDVAFFIGQNKHNSSSLSSKIFIPKAKEKCKVCEDMNFAPALAKSINLIDMIKLKLRMILNSWYFMNKIIVI